MDRRVKKIAFFDTKPYDGSSFSRVSGEDLTFHFFETKLTPDTAGLADGYDGVCVFVNDTVDAPVIDRLCAGGVKVIALRCAGFNNVDVQYAKGRMPVLRVPAYSPHAVAEHAAAMLLTSVRRIHKAYNRTRDFNFSIAGLSGFDIHGKTVGVVGTGKIGSCFIDIMRGFGARVLAYDKYPREDARYSCVSLDTLLGESDIISLHCPLTDDTYHLIDRDALTLLKRGVILINTSRGALIDADALLEGIKSRTVGAACLDVYEEESDLFFEDKSGHILDDDTLARLISMPNVLVTSHQGFLTEEALAAIASATADNLRTFFRTGTSDNLVSLPS